MKAIRLALGSFLSVALFSSIATAQAQRTFVSGLGDDNNPCNRTAPCRTFAHALMETSAGGEVVVLDSAGYGPFAITQAVSITAPPGVYAGISVFSGDGVDINAGSTDTVILRGLTINNQGSTGRGIVFNTGGTLHVESCVVNGFSASLSAGLIILGPGNLEVKDSIIRGNRDGIIIQPTSGTVQATIDQVRVEASLADGLSAFGGSKVTVRRSVASANGNTGFVASTNTSGAAQMTLEDCVASNNAGGVSVLSGSTAAVDVNVESCEITNNGVIGINVISTSTGVATARVSNSTVTGNGFGLLNQGAPALLLSRTNNTIEGNTTNTSGTIGSYTAK
jgi:hypothetical protein